jgi:hypothetical protein
MGFPTRSLALAALFALLAPTTASAQGAGPGPGGGTAPAPPPPGGGASPGPAGTGTGGTGTGGAAADEKKAGAGNVGGVSFSDKPARRAPVARAAIRRSGPLATFPGFEQLPDGGSRLFVQLSQAVPVEERRAQGSVTYVLKGAHLRVHNDANALVTVHFNTPVFRARLTPQGNDLLFVLELRSAVAPTFKVTENQDKTSTLQIDFPKGDFITGDGSESLPSESRGKAGGRAKGAKGSGAGRGNNGARPAPSTPPSDEGEPGPNP